MHLYVDAFSLQKLIVLMVLDKSMGGENSQFGANMPKNAIYGHLLYVRIEIFVTQPRKVVGRWFWAKIARNGHVYIQLVKQLVCLGAYFSRKTAKTIFRSKFCTYDHNSSQDCPRDFILGSK